MTERVVRVAAASLLFLGGCERLPTGPASPGNTPVRGITFVDWTAGGYAGDSAHDALAGLAGTGANTVVLIATAYQPDPEAKALRAQDPRTPSPGALRTALQAARDLGLRIVLKPHVDLDDGAWRGAIAPPDPAAWFASYRRFILPLAALADSVGAACFVVGTELGGTLEDEAEWLATIRAVRSVFSGSLLYAASWDEAARVPFWGALDLVGVDFYFPVATRRDPGRFDILAAWQPWVERLRLLGRQTGRRVLLTEVGYRSVDGAGMKPYARDGGGELDLAEQADLYWAALEATAGQSWCEGLCWWNWPADGSGGPRNRDYTPRGKPAERELAAAWGVER